MEDFAHHPLLLRLTVLYRANPIQLCIKPGSTLRELGQQLHSQTGADPKTIRLLVGHGSAFTPFSDEHAEIPIEDSGIAEGRVIRMMGALPEEVKEVARESGGRIEGRTIGFLEEERRAQQRLAAASSSHSGTKLPLGSYIFCAFRTLELPGIVLEPPPQKALEIMHMLANDPGIISIMNKYRWRVGVMTEMAPIGYVGITPKCVLGYNKNFGEEISLRIRTDDLKGFRKYDSIKRTLLHELTHMVHSEHDGEFYALNKQLNEEAISLDWTKSKGNTLSGLNYSKEGPLGAGDVQVEKVTRSYILGGTSGHELTARTAAAAAALHRVSNRSDDAMVSEGTFFSTRMADKRSGDSQEQEPDPNQMNERGIVEEPDAHDMVDSDKITNPNNEEFERTFMNAITVIETDRPHSSEKMPVEKSQQEYTDEEPDSDEMNKDMITKLEPDPDEINVDTGIKMEPDPDEMKYDMGTKLEPNPDEMISDLRHKVEPDPDEMNNAMGHRMKPDRDEMENEMGHTMEPDPDENNNHMGDKMEPDPDDEDARREDQGSGLRNSHVGDLNAKQNMSVQQVITELRTERSFLSLESEDSGVKAMEESAMLISTRLQQAITKLKEEATSSEFAVAVLTLITIVRNVMEHPDEGKYKCLRKKNLTFQSRVAKFQGALELLHAVGFSERPRNEIGEGECLVLSRNDPGLMWLARSFLETSMA